MSCIRTASGSLVNTAAIVEAFPDEVEQVVVLRLIDGSERVVTRDEWEKAMNMARTQVVPALAGTYSLFVGRDMLGGGFNYFKEPVLGWLLTPGLGMRAITKSGTKSSDVSIQFADGTVEDDCAGFDTIEEWARSRVLLLSSEH